MPNKSSDTLTSRIVTVAVMCVIAVISRTLFIWLPYIKPMAAIVIITGVSLGAGAGFVTGAVSVFLSDFIFGHGPWTPWQMAAFGMAGLLAGLCHRRGLPGRGRLSLCLFGGGVVLLVVGPILDSGTLFSMGGAAVQGGPLSIYRSGLPVNAVHALATAVTLLLVSQPMLEKLDRVKVKYGLYESSADTPERIGSKSDV